jgi:teichuronic acid exporter
VRTPVNISGQVVRGVSLLAGVALFSKVLSIAALVVLGGALAPADFGTYGIALGVLTLLYALRDGGIRQVLVQRGARSYSGLSGPVAWMLLLSNSVVGIVVYLAAPTISLWYADPGVALLLYCAAATLPLWVAGSMSRARLETQLQFRSLAIMDSISNVFHYGTMIIFALLGFGALSFVLPLLIVGIIDALVGYGLARDFPLSRSPRFRIWPALFARAKWLLLGGFFRAGARGGDYVVLGALVSSYVMGLYTFAYQVAWQSTALFGTALHRVLFPAMAALSRDTRRFQRSAVTSLAAMVIAASYIAFGLALTFPGLDSVLWQGKWLDAELPVQVLAVVFPLRLVADVVVSVVVATGQMRLAAALLLWNAIGTVIFAAIAGYVANSATEVAIWLACYIGVGGFTLGAIGYARVGILAASYADAVLRPWILALCCALVSALAYEPGLRGGDARTTPNLGWDATFAALVFITLYTASLRLMMPLVLTQIVHGLPGSLRSRLKHLLVLKAGEQL